jgi:hypothetical protein
MDNKNQLSDPSELEQLELVPLENSSVEIAQSSFAVTLKLDGNQTMKGIKLTTFSHPLIHCTSKIFASVCEPTGNWTGAAVYQVLNVIPREGKVHIVIKVDWNNPLPVRTDLLVYNN